MLFNNREVFFTPALPLEDVLDPTGAGDSFNWRLYWLPAKNGRHIIRKHEKSCCLWICDGIIYC